MVRLDQVAPELRRHSRVAAEDAPPVETAVHPVHQVQDGERDRVEHEDPEQDLQRLLEGIAHDVVQGIPPSSTLRPLRRSISTSSQAPQARRRVETRGRAHRPAVPGRVATIGRGPGAQEPGPGQGAAGEAEPSASPPGREPSGWALQPGQVRPILSEPCRAPPRADRLAAWAIMGAPSRGGRWFVPGLALVARTAWGAGGQPAHSGDGGSLGLRRGVAVLVHEGRIGAVAPAAEAGSLGADRVIDLGDVTLLPGFEALGAAAGGRPVYVSRIDGHQGLATLDVLGEAGALAAVGCDRGTDGVPTGVVRHDANHHARRHALGQLPSATLAAAQDQALALAARRGVVCVHEMGGPDISSRRDFELLLGRLDSLPLQVVCYWGAFELDYVLDRKLPQIGGDLFLDGSLGSHTAALSTPYDDRPETRGSLYHDDAELTELYVRATMAGSQVGVHAIGDRAIGQALRCARRAVRVVGHTPFAACRSHWSCSPSAGVSWPGRRRPPAASGPGSAPT